MCYLLSIRGPQGRIAKAVFQFGPGGDWLKGAKMVRELEGTISTPQVGSLALKKLKGLAKDQNGRSYPSRNLLNTAPLPLLAWPTVESCLTTFERVLGPTRDSRHNWPDPNPVELRNSPCDPTLRTPIIAPRWCHTSSVLSSSSSCIFHSSGGLEVLSSPAST